MKLFCSAMKKIITISLLFAVFGCYQAARKAFTIKNLGKDTSFQIKASSNPTTVIIKLTGFSNDSFLIQNYFKIPGGNINNTVQMDFYNKVFDFSFNPYKAKKGKLTVEIYIP